MYVSFIYELFIFELIVQTELYLFSIADANNLNAKQELLLYSKYGTYNFYDFSKEKMENIRYMRFLPKVSTVYFKEKGDLNI